MCDVFQRSSRIESKGSHLVEIQGFTGQPGSKPTCGGKMVAEVPTFGRLHPRFCTGSLPFPPCSRQSSHDRVSDIYLRPSQSSARKLEHCSRLLRLATTWTQQPGYKPVLEPQQVRSIIKPANAIHRQCCRCNKVQWTLDTGSLLSKLQLHLQLKHFVAVPLHPIRLPLIHSK